jgi:putative phosphoesterase
MKFAVVGDIHSNIYALQSVIKDIRQKNVDFILSTGDLVGYLPFPNEVIDTVRTNGIICIQGNHDKYIGSCNPINRQIVDKMNEQELVSDASSAFTNMVLTDENRYYLSNMPSEIRLALGGHTVLVVHGSPRRIDEYLHNDPSKLRTIADETDADIIICGHTHIPFHSVAEGKHFVNAGSVGKPKHGNSNSTYVILELVRNGIYVDIIEVPYDVEKTIKTLEQGHMFDKKLPDMLYKGY